MAILTAILTFFKVAFKFAVGWIKGGRAFILAAISLYVAFVGWAVYQLWDSFDLVILSLDELHGVITNVMEYLHSFDWFNLLYYTFALDVLLKGIFSQVSVFFAFFGFSLVSAVLGGMAVFAPLLIWRVMAKMIASQTGGMVKV